MVANDEIDSETVGIVHPVHRFDAAIECNNQRAAFLFGGIDTFLRDAVPFRITVRDIINKVIRLCLEERVHERHGSRSVHVIIAIDHDALMVVNGSAKPVNGCAHILHQERVVQTV